MVERVVAVLRPALQHADPVTAAGCWPVTSCGGLLSRGLPGRVLAGGARVRASAGPDVSAETIVRGSCQVGGREWRDFAGQGGWRGSQGGRGG